MPKNCLQVVQALQRRPGNGPGAVNKQRSGLQSISTDGSHMKKLKDFVLKNRRLSIKWLANAMRISFAVTQPILVDALCLKRNILATLV